VDAARQQYLVAQNSASQSFKSLQAARARVALARKAMSDTAVRAPFSGIVGERLVSVGDYVTRGTRVATVVRIDPMRVELTIPEQAVSLVRVGQPVRLTVDAYPNEVFEARIRFVSPSLRADQRALTVEAIMANADGRLKPGLFATASIQQPQSAPALLVPATAVETVSGTSRVYVIKDDTIEERIVTLGERVGDQVELTSGVSKGETVAREPNGRLTDGVKVQAH
jgi:RND family efflux transporter MFP subunit